ncbi:hypothetical protein [Streptomyces cavernae]|uniref:hypothetical protein n=1 Tax=Streptomyces cavernae TaxID=2259034 RepID=UPI0012D880AA|nr:hypothetical protein [Streptomyces cavernae]
MSDELSTALRELAARHETAPVVTGAEVRGRAVRRGRRRRATLVLGAGATALAVVTFVLTLNTGDGGTRAQVPAATPAASAPTSSASPARPVATTGSVDFRKKVLIFGDHVMRLSSGAVKAREPMGLLTVAVKWDTKLVASEKLFKKRFTVEVPYVVELRGADNDPVYVGAVTYAAKAPDDSEPLGGWIGLNAKDALWLYDKVRVGDHFSVSGAPEAGTDATASAPETIPTDAGGASSAERDTSSATEIMPPAVRDSSPVTDIMPSTEQDPSSATDTIRSAERDPSSAVVGGTG